jgi:hypothetical protein
MRPGRKKARLTPGCADNGTAAYFLAGQVLMPNGV